MKQKFAPIELSDLIIDVFSDQINPSPTQIATVSEEGMPEVRTVHVRFLKGEGALGFNTNRESPKWKSLKHKPFIAGCHYSPHRFIQFRFEANVEFVEKDCPLLDEMWNTTSPEVKNWYWDKKERHPKFAIVIIVPYRWDIYELGSDLSKGQRTIYRSNPEGWSAQKVSTLDSKPL